VFREFGRIVAGLRRSLTPRDVDADEDAADILGNFCPAILLHDQQRSPWLPLRPTAAQMLRRYPGAPPVTIALAPLMSTTTPTPARPVATR
jgi:hypothetical protein